MSETQETVPTFVVPEDAPEDFDPGYVGDDDFDFSAEDFEEHGNVPEDLGDSE